MVSSTAPTLRRGSATAGPVPSPPEVPTTTQRPRQPQLSEIGHSYDTLRWFRRSRSFDLAKPKLVCCHGHARPANPVLRIGVPLLARIPWPSKGFRGRLDRTTIR